MPPPLNLHAGNSNAIVQSSIGQIHSTSPANSPPNLGLAENFRAAELANVIVAKLFPKGAGNQQADVKSSEGESFWRSAEVYAIGSGANKRPPLANAPFELILRDVERGIAFQGGNCDYFGRAAFVTLASLDSFLPSKNDSTEKTQALKELGLDKLLDIGERPPKINGKIHLVADNVLMHVFVVIGETPYDRDGVIVDAWVLEPRPHLLREGAFQPRLAFSTHDPQVDGPLIDPVHVRDLREMGKPHLTSDRAAIVRQEGMKMTREKFGPGSRTRIYNQVSSRLTDKEIAKANGVPPARPAAKVKSFIRSFFSSSKTTSL